MSAKTLFNQRKQISESIPCELIRVIPFDNREIKLVKENRHTLGCIGIHLNNPTRFNLEMSINQAVIDGYERIYIKGKTS